MENKNILSDYEYKRFNGQLCKEKPLVQINFHTEHHKANPCCDCTAASIYGSGEHKKYGRVVPRYYFMRCGFCGAKTGLYKKPIKAVKAFMTFNIELWVECNDHGQLNKVKTWKY
jgi:hypothetical protein